MSEGALDQRHDDDLDETMLYDAAICWRPDVLSEPDRTAI
jgi:hypothetical protein